jgi:ABC-type phosphate transport system auxiliary subunit
LAHLEHILDEKNRENERLRARLGHNAKGFEALAVTVNHLAKKLDEFDKLDYTTRLNDLKHQVQSKEEQLEQLRLQISQKQNETDIDEVEASGIIKTLENRLNILQDEHEELVEKLRHDHKSEMDLQAQSHQGCWNTFSDAIALFLQDHEARHNNSGADGSKGKAISDAKGPGHAKDKS